jgi:hypothetical protein
MILEVVKKEQNRRLVTKQTEGPFQEWESTQEFQSNGNNSTNVNHTTNYKLTTIGKISNFLTGGQAENKIREGGISGCSNGKTKIRIKVMFRSYCHLYFEDMIYQCL